MKTIKFGRLKEFDLRSRGYSIRALIPKGLKPRSYTWRCSINLDQGNLPACVGFSVCHEAAARPVEVPGLTNAIAKQIYYRAQELDDFPGTDYDGSSVLGAVKAGMERKWYGSYRWAFGEADLCLAVGYKGPVILGVNWYSGMMDPDSQGIIKPTGALEGGHAILCTGINLKTGLYRLHNSWGQSFGINGDCFISRPDMTLLLVRDGEACIPIARGRG